MPVTEVRTYCRRCRVKLGEPTENQRSAFCCRGCYRLFYAGRCLVCEGLMKRNAGHQLVCSRPACKIEFRTLKRHGVLGGFYGPKTSIGHLPTGRVGMASADPIKQGVYEAGKTDRPCRIVAGPPLTRVQIRLVTVGATSRNCPFEQDRNLNSRRELKASGSFVDSAWSEVISAEGVRCFVASRDRAT